MKLYCRWLVVLATLWACTAASACDFWLSVDFADGTKGCLADYPISRAVSTVIERPVAAAVPRVGVYAVAAPTSNDAAACPAVVGMSLYDTSLGTTATNLPPLDRRLSEAVGRCNAALGSQPHEGCTCRPVLVDGVTTLSRASFAALGTGAAVAAPLPATAPPTGTAPPPSNAASLQAELAAMRDKIAALERSRNEPAAGGQRAPRATARALVIGNGAYSSFGKLPNPRNDATAVAAKLRSFGIEVDLVVDADREKLINALAAYAFKAAKADVNILFYAGHGVQVDGVNYIIPTNMRAEGITAGYIKLTGIALHDALEYLPAKTRIVFLDACRDNPVTRSLAGRRGGSSAGLAPVSVASGTLIAYATRDGSAAEDGAGANSPYTAALLANLDTPQDISLVLRHVRQMVMRSTGGRQEPWEYGSLVGDQLVLSRMARR